MTFRRSTNAHVMIEKRTPPRQPEKRVNDDLRSRKGFRGSYFVSSLRKLLDSGSIS
jgi:hypothetical protein